MPVFQVKYKLCRTVDDLIKLTIVRDTKIMDSHKFTDDEVAEFKDAFELFDKTGTGIIPYSECANLARCFGYDPLESTVRQLLGGGEETPASKEDMENKSISFEDYLPVLWGIANSPAPGNLEDFLECLKVYCPSST